MNEPVVSAMNAVVLSERPHSAQQAAALLGVTGGAARPGPPGPGQLLVRLRAAAISLQDLRPDWRAGLTGGGGGPRVPGREFSGEVGRQQ